MPKFGDEKFMGSFAAVQTSSGLYKLSDAATGEVVKKNTPLDQVKGLKSRVWSLFCQGFSTFYLFISSHGEQYLVESILQWKCKPGSKFRKYLIKWIKPGFNQNIYLDTCVKHITILSNLTKNSRNIHWNVPHDPTEASHFALHDEYIKEVYSTSKLIIGDYSGYFHDTFICLMGLFPVSYRTVQKIFPFWGECRNSLITSNLVNVIPYSRPTWFTYSNHIHHNP